MARKCHIATIQILVEDENHASACDGISEMFHNVEGYVIDWAYLKVNGQILVPTEKIIDDDYFEGDAFI